MKKSPTFGEAIIAVANALDTKPQSDFNSALTVILAALLADLGYGGKEMPAPEVLGKNIHSQIARTSLN